MLIWAVGEAYIVSWNGFLRALVVQSYERSDWRTEAKRLVDWGIVEGMETVIARFKHRIPDTGCHDKAPILLEEDQTGFAAAIERSMHLAEGERERERERDNC